MVQMYGNIDANTCPHCGRVYDGKYILEHRPCPTVKTAGLSSIRELPFRERCWIISRSPGRRISLPGQSAAGAGHRADFHLGSLVRYFQGNLLAVVNSREELSDYKADCFCEGNAAEIMAQAYPGNHPLDAEGSV